MGKPASSGDSSSKGIQEDLESYGRGYDKIGSRDAVEKLWDWLDEDEHKVLLEHYRRSHTPKYDDTRSILLNVTLDELLNVINHGVPANNWPTTKFNNKGCTEGFSKMLYEHPQVQRLKDKIASLEGKSNRSNRTSPKPRNKRNNKVDVEATVSDEPFEPDLFGDNDLTPASQPTKRKKPQGKGRRNKKKKGKKGKAQQPSKKEQDGVPPYADCLAKGLGIRRHKDNKCDPNLQKQALEKLEREQADKQNKSKEYYLKVMYICLLYTSPSPRD